jgi:hypothetical protein
MSVFEKVRERFARNPAASKWTVLLAASALIGAWLGAFYFSTWQAAVETAQVHAGIVEYPLDNPFNHYHLKAWSLLHNVLAPFLWLGVPERALSIALSMGLCAAAFVLLASVAFMLSENVALSVFAPVSLLAMYIYYSIHGPVYPLVIIGNYHTYGVAGRAVALGILITLAARRYRLGGFLIAVAPGLHLTWGLWAAGLAALGLAWEFRTTRNQLRLLAEGLAAGAAVTAASLGYQYLISRGLPTIPPEEQQRYLDAFAAWDPHRDVVGFLQPGPALALATTVLSGLWLWRFGSALTASQTFLLRVFLLSGVLGFAAALLTWLPWVPGIVDRLMPGRFLNLPILVLFPLLLGLLGQRRDWPSRVVLFACLLYVPATSALLDGSAEAFRNWFTGHWKAFIGVSVLLGVIAVWKPRQAPTPARLDALVPAVVAMVFLVMLPGHLGKTMPHRHPNAAVMPLLTTTPDTVLEAARAGDGMLVIGADLQFIQLKTGRAVLLSSALNQLPYVPDSGPAMHQILLDVYGFDLFAPPDTVSTSRGRIRHFAGHAKRVWEARDAVGWTAIRDKYGVSQVLTQSHWTLDLPLIAENDRHRLYEIPPTERTHRLRRQALAVQ